MEKDRYDLYKHFFVPLIVTYLLILLLPIPMGEKIFFTACAGFIASLFSKGFTRFSLVYIATAVVVGIMVGLSL
ncbi:MAG: hypothetical protein AB7W16_01800 [Candidatus Obscuribacterales bacterium]